MEETITNRLDVKFRISKINLLKCEINTPEIIDQKLEVNYSFSLNNGIDFDTNHIIVGISVLIHGASQENRFAQFDASIVYSIEDIAGVVKKMSDDTFEVHNQFLVTLNSISLSTMRGIIFSNLRGTFLEQFYMPLIDPKILTKTEFNKKNNVVNK